MKTIFILPFLFLSFFNLAGQDLIQLENPSFEGQKQATGWIDCELPNDAPPITQPCKDPSKSTLKLTQKAIDGETFLCLLANDDDTYGKVSQALSTPLIAQKTYRFSIHLSSEDALTSLSKRTNEEVDYNRPIVFRIYGANSSCDKIQLLAETEAIDHPEWRTYEFVLEPDSNYTHIRFQAYYKAPCLASYNGNVMVDHASDIIEVENQETQEIEKNIKSLPKQKSTNN